MRRRQRPCDTPEPAFPRKSGDGQTFASLRRIFIGPRAHLWVRAGGLLRPEEHVARNGCKVLVVDDDRDNRELLVELLESAGYSAVGADNGSRALSALEEGLDPDLILTDLQMPVMSGWDLCESLKRDPSLRSIPVVLLCAMAANERGKLQVDDAFEKPTDTSLLLARIAELCGL